MIIKPFVGFKPKKYPDGSVTQWFGENEELYQRAVIINGVPLQGHNGHDYVAPWGTPQLAVEDGVICDVKEDAGGFGMHVRILAPETMHEWTYGHLSKIRCQLGQKVKVGDIIGNMGNTGFVVSTTYANKFWGKSPETMFPGTHVHFGLRQMRLNPNGWKYAGYKNRVEVLNYDNGYFGAIDPTPYLSIPEKTDWSTPENFARLLEFIRLVFRR